MDDELEYLAPDFDINTLTVPKLRGILVEHDVAFPSSAKKSQLVEIFTERIKPRAKKLLAARDRIRRTSHGIEDMPTSSESTQTMDDEPATTIHATRAMPPPPKPKTPGRKTTRPSSETPRDSSPIKRTPSHKSSTKKLRPTAPEDSEEEKPRPSARKSRRSEVAPAGPITPAVKIEEPRKVEYNGSNFSNDNPFQSGGSFDDDGRRKSSGVKSPEKRRSSTSRRRTTDGSVEKSKRSSGASTTVHLPVARVRKSDVKREETIEPGEEFTAEEQQELVREGAVRGEVDVMAPRKVKKNRRQSQGYFPKRAPLVIISTLLAGLAAWYRKEKVEVGYCGVGKSIGLVQEYELPDWAEIIQPQCEPCPTHAFCYSGMEVECEPDFMLVQHPLSVNGLVPLPPTCEPDSEKLKKVQAVANKAVDELRERKAKFECGGLTESDGTPATTLEIEEPQLKAEVSKKKRKGMSSNEFEELWKGAVGEILAREEVTSDNDGSNSALRLSSSSLARLSLGCAIRRSFRQTVVRYRVPLASLIAIAVAAIYAYNRVNRTLKDKARVPALVASTFDRLATHAALYAQGSVPEPFISMGQMRDDVLREEFSIDRRDQIWNRVKEAVEMNANIRPSVREDRHGEVSRVWEWIGNLPALTNGWDGDRRQSGRYSIGPNAVSGGSGYGTPDRTSSPEPTFVKREIVETRKWDEGRPIY